MTTNNTEQVGPPPPAPVSILVYRNDLKSVIGNGLPKLNWLGRRKIFRTWKRVLVEPATAGVRDSVFFAPYEGIGESRATATQFVNVNPAEHNDIVREDDQFEISFTGMSISPQDTNALNNNELLLYSLTKDDASQDAGLNLDLRAASPSPLASPPALDAIRRKSMRSLYYTSPTGFSPAPSDSPFIHFDPVVDGHDSGNEPDVFVPVPHSKSLYLQNNCRGSAQTEVRKSVSIRFSVLELDKVSDTQIRAITGLGDLGQTFGQGAVAMPYLELLSGAFEIASVLGKKSLEKYSRPDLVLSKDLNFKLAPAIADDVRSTSSGEQTEADPQGSYLRYGYYFFLSKSVDAKLYAQTGSSSQNVPLLLKREGFDPTTAPKNEKPYFPLTGISYVVVRVSRGTAQNCSVEREAVKKEHKRRLDSLLQMSNMMEMFANSKANRGSRRVRKQSRTNAGKKRKNMS